MKRVLIADDTKNIRNILKTYLELEGYEVVTASDGMQALEILKAGEMDLVFLDIKMPGISGTEVLRRIRGMGINTPVIIMTAFGTVKNAVDCTRLGAAAYIQKPFSVDKVKAVMDDLAKSRYTGLQSENIGSYITDIEERIDSKNYEEAVMMLRRLISVDIANPTVYLLLSKAYEGIGDTENSQKFFYAYKMFS